MKNGKPKVREELNEKLLALVRDGGLIFSKISSYTNKTHIKSLIRHFIAHNLFEK